MTLTIITVTASVAISYFLGWISGTALGATSVLLAVKDHCGEPVAIGVAKVISSGKNMYARQAKQLLRYLDRPLQPRLNATGVDQMSKIGMNARAHIRHMANAAQRNHNRMTLNPEMVIELLDRLQELEEKVSQSYGEEPDLRIGPTGDLEITEREKEKVRNFGVSNGYLQQKLVEEAEEKIKAAIADAAEKVTKVEELVRPLVDRAFRFFGGLNIQDFPMATQRTYLFHIEQLGRLLKGRAWFEVPPSAPVRVLAATGDQQRAEDLCNCAGCVKVRSK